MKQILNLILVLLFSYGAFSQSSVRFKKFYNLPPHFYSGSYDVTTTDFGYILSGITVDTTNGFGYNKLTLLALDTLGDSLWAKSYGSTVFQYAHDYNSKWMIKKGNSLFMALPVVKPTEEINVLIKFNLSGDTLWQREYTDIQKYFVFEGFNPTPDGGFIFTGYVADSIYMSMLLLKTDSLGNELWRKKINTNTFWIDGRSVLYDSINEKYVIVGTHGPPSSNDILSIVIIADSSGNKLNQFSYSSSFGGCLFNLIQTFDNNFVACGYNSTGIPFGAYTKARAQLVKFNISGSQLWSKEYYTPSIFNEFFILKELPDHNLIIAGQYDTLANTGTSPANVDFIIQKTNPNGDSIWMRMIDLSGLNAQDRLNSMDFANDNGFVLTGYFPQGPSPNRFVLVKLDSLGCDSLNCQTVGIKEIKKNKIDFLLYPNPANDNISFLYKSDKDLMVNIEIRDIIGRLVDKFELNSNSQKDYSTNKLNGSMFFVNVIIEGAITTQQKIVLIK